MLYRVQPNLLALHITISQSSTYQAPGTLRAPVLLLRVPALSTCRRSTALWRDALEELHGLPTGWTARYGWRDRHPWYGRYQCWRDRRSCLLNPQKCPYLLQCLAIPHPKQPVIADFYKAVG